MPSAVSSAERNLAARAHLYAWLSILPLLGLFPTVGLYNRCKDGSPWVAQQALQAVLFQVVTFNVLLVVLAIIAPIALVAWSTRYDGDALALAVLVTVLPFFALHYVAQGVSAVQAARAIRRRQEFRYRVIGRLVGAPVSSNPVQDGGD